MDYIYWARLEADPDGGFVVTFPDVPEAISSGESERTARANGAEALGLALRGIVADGRPLPAAATRGKDLLAIPVDADTALKLAVIEAFRAARISKSELGRRMGRAENEARRILDPDHATKLPALREALAVLGKEIVVSVRDAA